MSNWSQAEAIELCRLVESICPQFGCHVALTGGTLYRDGLRKDCDILFYRIRQVEEIDVAGPWSALAAIGLVQEHDYGWCHKANYKGKGVDAFFPECGEGDYPQQADAPMLAEYVK